MGIVCLFMSVAVAALIGQRLRIKVASIGTSNEAAESSLRMVSVHSALLSAHFHRPISIGAQVVTPSRPLGPGDTTPIVYHLPGLGSCSTYPEELQPVIADLSDSLNGSSVTHVFLNPEGDWGYHFYVDSDTNGPVAEALVRELIPRIHKELGLKEDSPQYLVGFSSGGWTAAWLLLSFPGLFDGAWIIAPDPLDFRSFFQVDLSPGSVDNMYTSPAGAIRYERRGGVLTQRDYIEDLEREGRQGAEFGSYEASFSPKGQNGLPKELFDRTTGALRQETLLAWTKYDLASILEQRWAEKGDLLKGKFHIYCGAEDTFFLNEPTQLFCDRLLKLDPTSRCEFIPGAGHMGVLSASERYPDGLLVAILSEMLDR